MPRLLSLVAGLLAVTCTLGCGSSPASFVNESYAGPVYFGFDAEMRRELRQTIVDYSNAEDTPRLSIARMKQLETEFFEEVKKLIDEFEIKPDSQGNYSWPDEFTDPLTKPFEQGTLVERIDTVNRSAKLRLSGINGDFDLPEWAFPLVEQYRAGKLEGKRKDLLRLVIITIVVRRLT